MKAVCMFMTLNNFTKSEIYNVIHVNQFGFNGEKILTLIDDNEKKTMISEKWFRVME